MNTEFWIEKAQGKSIDNAVIGDSYMAIEELISSQDPNAVFWVGHIQQEYVLKICKDLETLLIYGKNQDKALQITAGDWEQVKVFLTLYFNKEFTLLRNEFQEHAVK